MEKEEVKQMVDTSVKEALTPSEERLTAIEKGLEEIKTSMAGDGGKGEGEGKSELDQVKEQLAGKEKEIDELKTEFESFKGKMTESIEGLTTASKSADGQDGDEDPDKAKKSDDDPFPRDSYGRRVKTKI